MAAGGDSLSIFLDVEVFGSTVSPTGECPWGDCAGEAGATVTDFAAESNAAPAGLLWNRNSNSAPTPIKAIAITKNLLPLLIKMTGRYVSRLAYRDPLTTASQQEI